jgi:biopolymer transport protein ExbB
MNPAAVLGQGDAVSVIVAATLLLMSIASWVVIAYKSWLLWRARQDVNRAASAFWQAANLEQARAQTQAIDRHQLLTPLLTACEPRRAGTLAASGDTSQQLTRVLRNALHQSLQQLNQGQVLLATVGSTAPFVGLLGTVWGIYHALTGISGAGQLSIDKVSGPVGEALIMTAAGLAVAIPAVLAYNVLGKMVSGIEADLEGFARDLRELLSHPSH